MIHRSLARLSSLLVCFIIVLPSVEAGTKKSEEPNVVGEWEHSVEKGKTFTMTLLADGKINKKDGPSSWSLSGRTLTLKWKAKDAPGGFWVDEVTVSADGKAYAGKNTTTKVVVKGKKLGDEVVKKGSEDTSKPNPKDEDKGSAEGETTAVIAEGVGATADDALKDAFRNAVRQVVGAVVEAETLVKNDEVISDKVLTYSGGFVKKYEEISKKEEKGLFRIKIKAGVERRGVVARLKEAKVAVKDVDGQNLFGEAITKEEAKKNATELLTKALSGLPLLLTAEAASKPEYDSAEKKLSLDVRFQVDRKGYANYQKQMDELLKKISLAQDSATCDGKADKEFSKGHFANLLELKNQHLAGPKLDTRGKNTWCLWMNTFANDSHTRTKWNAYTLDADLAKVLASLQGKYRVTISLQDDKGELVTEEQFELPVNESVPETTFGKKVEYVLPVLWDAELRKKDGTYMANKDHADTLKWVNGEGKDRGWSKEDYAVNFFLSPYFFKAIRGTYSGVGLRYQPDVVLHRQVAVSLDELKRIKKVECKVQFRPEAGSDDPKKGK